MQETATRASIPWAICIALTMLYVSSPVDAQEPPRSGEQVVKEVCAECHRTGVDDAPKISDREAWRGRASQGLTALTRHALDGIRQMPAHGGHPELTDLEIAKAITYMVNASGGNWVPPRTDSELMQNRKGEMVVESVCAACHREGKDGAPRIGDTDAWSKRLHQGLPYAVQSAIRGHGGMPPRGGAADLTDTEIRNAIVYMLNPRAATEPASARVAEAQSSPSTTNHAAVGGMDIYLGVVSAGRLRDYPEGSVERSMHGGIPTGDDWYHVNVSVLDSEGQAPVTDAQVSVRIRDPDTTVRTKQLEPMMISQGGSYGNYFRMGSKEPYQVTVRVRTGNGQPVEAAFQYQHD